MLKSFQFLAYLCLLILPLFFTSNADDVPSNAIDAPAEYTEPDADVFIGEPRLEDVKENPSSNGISKASNSSDFENYDNENDGEMIRVRRYKRQLGGVAAAAGAGTGAASAAAGAAGPAAGAAQAGISAGANAAQAGIGAAQSAIGGAAGNAAKAAGGGNLPFFDKTGFPHILNDANVMKEYPGVQNLCHFRGPTLQQFYVKCCLNYHHEDANGNEATAQGCGDYGQMMLDMLKDCCQNAPDGPHVKPKTSGHTEGSYQEVNNLNPEQNPWPDRK